MPTSRKRPASPKTKPHAKETGLTFDGFPAEGFLFLRKLKKNNDRDWFREHKTAYQETVEQPMAKVVLTVGEECQARGVPLYPKDKNPVMRVYRDIRFSSDKTPYKAHVAAELRRSFSGSQTMLYLHFAPEKSFVAAGVWQPDRALLQAWRAAMICKPEEIEEVANSLKRKKIELDWEESLSSMPRGFQNFAALPLARFLKLTSFVCSRTLDQKDCTDSKLVGKIVNFALDVQPLLEYGWKVEGTLPKSFQD